LWRSGRPAEAALRAGGAPQIGLKKYAAVSPSAFGLVGRKRIAVIRSAGAIVGGAPCAPLSPVASRHPDQCLSLGHTRFCSYVVAQESSAGRGSGWPIAVHA